MVNKFEHIPREEDEDSEDYYKRRMQDYISKMDPAVLKKNLEDNAKEDEGWVHERPPRDDSVFDATNTMTAGPRGEVNNEEEFGSDAFIATDLEEDEREEVERSKKYDNKLLEHAKRNYECYFMLPEGSGRTRSLELMGGVQGWAGMCPADDDLSGKANWMLHVQNKAKLMKDGALASEADEIDIGKAHKNPYEEMMSYDILSVSMYFIIQYSIF